MILDVAPGNIIRFENNLYTFKLGGGPDDLTGFPMIFPHTMAKDLRELKGISLGDWGEVCRTTVRTDSGNYWTWKAPELDHLNIYVQSRFLWDAGRNIDSLLEEYYALFYGPASNEMKAALEYAEANREYARKHFFCYKNPPGQNCMLEDPYNLDLSVRNQLLEMLQEARDTAGKTVYGERIQMIIDELQPEEVKVTVTIVNQDTGEPVAHANIYYGGNIFSEGLSNTTGLKGTDSIYLAKGEWVYTVQHDNYFTLTDTVLITGDTSMVIPLVWQNHTSFHVIDRATEEPVWRAVIHFGDDMKITDADGEIRISFQKGELIYTIEHNDYFRFSDSAMICGDTTLVVLLTRKLADIYFEVSDASGPLPGVSLLLNDWEILTNSIGTACINNQPARQHYGYSVQMEGYRTVSDSLFLEIDTTVTILLQPVTGAHPYAAMETEIFPNPVAEKLFIRTEQRDALIVLLNPEGKILAERKIFRGVNTIDVSWIPPGLYILCIQAKEKVIHRKVLFSK